MFTDQTICVCVEVRPDGRAILRQSDGDVIELRSIATANELIAREKLPEVARFELRAMIARNTASINWASLRQAPSGKDAPDITALKAIAVFQETFRAHTDGFEWWRRFCAFNRPEICLELLKLLLCVRSQCETSRPGYSMPIDYLELLHRSLSATHRRDLASVETCLRQLLSEAADE